MNRVTVKEQLYYLINHVKKGNYDISTFSDLFTVLVNLEMRKEDFTEAEKKVFKNLNSYTCRFSEFEEDLKIPNAFYDEETIRKQVDIAIESLKIEL